MTESATIQWFAMRVTYRRELSVKTLLEEKGLTCFIPMQYRLTTVGHHRKKELVPVIHNLIFVRSSQDTLQQIKERIPHLQYIINTRTREKIIIPDIEMKRFIAVSGTCDEQLLYFKPDEVNWKKGTRVRICGGDFEGLEGTFVKVKGARDRRVVICIKGVVAVAMATLHPDMIEKLPDRPSDPSSSKKINI